MAIHLTSSSNRHVKALIALRQQRHRRHRGQFIAEGARQIARAMDAGLRLREVYTCQEQVKPDAGLLQRMSQSPEVLWFTVTDRLMTRMAYRQNPQGLLAIFEQPSLGLTDLPRCWHQTPPQGGGDPEACHTRDERYAMTQPATPQGIDPQPPPQVIRGGVPGEELWLVAVGTQKPGNLGAMARCAEAAGCWGLIVADGVVDAFNPNTIHASTGAVFSLPMVAAPSSAVRAFLHQRAVRTVATSPDAQTPYTEVDLTGPVAVVVGAEDAGLGPIWLEVKSAEASDTRLEVPLQTVHIPMRGHIVDSLNASVATGVVLFEAVRQRRVGRSHPG